MSSNSSIDITFFFSQQDIVYICIKMHCRVCAYTMLKSFLLQNFFFYLLNSELLWIICGFLSPQYELDWPVKAINDCACGKNCKQNKNHKYTQQNEDCSSAPSCKHTFQCIGLTERNISVKKKKWKSISLCTTQLSDTQRNTKALYSYMALVLKQLSANTPTVASKHDCLGAWYKWASKFGKFKAVLCVSSQFPLRVMLLLFCTGS